MHMNGVYYSESSIHKKLHVHAAVNQCSSGSYCSRNRERRTNEALGGLSLVIGLQFTAVTFKSINMYRFVHGNVQFDGFAVAKMRGVPKRTSGASVSKFDGRPVRFR